MPSVPPYHHDHPGSPQEPSLSTLLKAWRARAGPTRGNRRRVLSQAHLAQRANVSERWYRKLESGERIRTDRDALDRLSQALNLSQAERLTLYLHTTQLTPPPPAEPDTDIRQDLPSLVEHFRPHAVFLTNNTWDILGYNQRMADWFSWVTHPDANLARWFLGNSDARFQVVAWEEKAIAFLAVLRFAYAHNHHNPRFRELLTHVLDDPRCRQLWDGNLDVTESLDTLRVDFRLARYRFETTPTTIHVLHPASHPTSRLTILAEHNEPD